MSPEAETWICWVVIVDVASFPARSAFCLTLNDLTDLFLQKGEQILLAGKAPSLAGMSILQRSSPACFPLVFHPPQAQVRHAASSLSTSALPRQLHAELLRHPETVLLNPPFHDLARGAFLLRLLNRSR